MVRTSVSQACRVKVPQDIPASSGRNIPDLEDFPRNKLLPPSPRLSPPPYSCNQPHISKA